MIDSKVRSAQYLRDFPELSRSLKIMDKKGQGTFASVFAVQGKNDKESDPKYALKMLIPTVDVRRIENEVRILRRLGLYLVDFGLAHSEVYGDVDDRWELDCQNKDANDKHLSGQPINRRRKHCSSSDDRQGEVTRPTKAPRLSEMTLPKQSPGSGTPQTGISPNNLRYPQDGNAITSRVSADRSRAKRNLGPMPSHPTAFAGDCVCGTRLTICRGCRQLPRLNAARRGGTLGFRPPEVMMRHADQTTAVDIWAAGIIFLSFLSGRYPFIKVEDDLDVLHTFAHLLSYERMQAGAKSMGRRLLMDPKPSPMSLSDTPSSWLKTRCIAIRKNEKKLIGLPPLLSASTTKATGKSKETHIALPATHVFPEAAYELAVRMLEPNPQKRITAADALRHNYLNPQRKPSTTCSKRLENAKPQTTGSPLLGRATEEVEAQPFRTRAQFC